MTNPEPPRTAADRPGRRLGAVGVALTIFGLSGLAIGLPLFSVLGPSATFFTAHGARSIDVIAFAAALIVLPGLVATAVILVLRRISPGGADLVTHAVVGGLTSALIVPGLSRAFGLRTIVFAVVAVAIAVGVTVLHARKPEVRALLRVSAIGPVILAAWFLFFSTAASVVLPPAAVADARAARDANVVFIIFDEFPLAAILDGEGNINERRFPNFAELASRSTWYRGATTVAPWTNLAVPGLLSGRMPIADASSEYYSRNLFSMLAPTHDLVTMEYVSRLCRVRACDSESDIAGMYKDASVLYLHRTLPKGAAARWLPPLGDRWANFAKPDRPVPGRHGKEASDQGARFEALLDQMNRGDEPTLWFGHYILPHMPLKHLPDGRIYDNRPAPYGIVGDNLAYWADNPPAQDLGRQRFLLQTQYTDRLIGQLIDRLTEQDLYDDTMVVIAADHGLSFTEGSRRGAPYSASKAPEILPVPLFVKYPGQTRGAVADPSVQTLDVMPTIAETLDVDLSEEWRFDGRTLRDAERGEQHPNRYFDGGPKATPPAVVDPAPAVEPYLELFGQHGGDHDLFAWGPHRGLVGQRVPSDAPSASRSVELDSRRIVSEDTGGLTPALIEVTFDRGPRLDWFAVGVNGTIAGLGRTVDDAGKGFAMIDPTWIEDGPNEVEILGVDGSGELTAFDLATG